MKLLSTALAFVLFGMGSLSCAQSPTATKEFSLKEGNPHLGGEPVRLWGIRCGNALHSDVITERHIRNFDNMTAHGINLIGVYLQGTNAGFPDAEAGANGITRDGKLKPKTAARLESFIREADKRGMVVMVGIITPRKDQEFYDEAAIQSAIQETAKFLTDKKLKNVFVDLMHEFSHPERADFPLLREPDGAKKKAKLHAWFKEFAPDIEAGVCPDINSGSADAYPGMEARLIQKNMPIPQDGFVVNVETLRQDFYQNDGVFTKSNIDYILNDCKEYGAAPNRAMLFHAGFIQGITCMSGSAPHPEMGGYGTGPNDRGVRFYYEWVRDHYGRWEYPKHVPVK